MPFCDVDGKDCPIKQLSRDMLSGNLPPSNEDAGLRNKFSDAVRHAYSIMAGHLITEGTCVSGPGSGADWKTCNNSNARTVTDIGTAIGVDITTRVNIQEQTED